MKKTEQEPNLEYFEFLSKALSCHALCLLDELEIIEDLVQYGYFSKNQILESRNPSLLQAAFVTLINSGILSRDSENFQLTTLGEKVLKGIGSVTLPLKGYRGLFAKQFELLKNPSAWDESDIDYSAIANASTKFGIGDLDAFIVALFQKLSPKGTLCDLGSGIGEKLVKICDLLEINGLGIEQCPKVVKKGREHFHNKANIELLSGDVTKLEGVWEDVDTALMSQVYHDIPTQNCQTFFNDLPKHFPRLAYLVIVDIVSISEGSDSIMPGFDYVHGLQGVIPRSREETLETFKNIPFRIIEELSVPNMPNTYAWVLQRIS